MTQREIALEGVRPGEERRGFWHSVWFPALVLVLTVAQLAVAEYVPGIERFADKAFGARLIAYPVMMLFVPAVWWLVQRRRGGTMTRPPHLAFGLIGLPFLVDVTGNSLDLYDTVGVVGRLQPLHQLGLPVPGPRAGDRAAAAAGVGAGHAW